MFIEDASKVGLRTLMIAVKVVSEQELQTFLADCAEAESNFKNCDALLAQVYDKFERNLFLVGSTAVEDKLQEQVPETIKDLQTAGIKIWMLTGDKFETAENIGLSC